MEMSGIDWEYYDPIDREKWMPKIILINVDKRFGRRTPPVKEDPIDAEKNEKRSS